MSNPNDFCISLELAKRLFNADIIIDSYFNWVDYKYVAYLETEKHPITWFPIPPRTIGKYPAPTFEELNLPDHIETEAGVYFLQIKLIINHWIINYYNPVTDKPLINRDKFELFPNDHKLVDVGACVLIELKKLGFLKEIIK